MNALLGPDAYWSEPLFEREQAQVFGRSWQLVGTCDELAGPGSFVTGTVGHDPVVVLRDRTGELRAFHNLCRHRGITLVEGCGVLGSRITCPYHAWSYDLEGRLRNVPQQAEQFPDLDLDAAGLVPAAVGVWEGFVFVAADAAGPSFDDAMAGLPAHLGSFRPSRLVEVARVRIEARCNWKLLVENHVDVYHLWYLHAGSLGEFDHARFEHRHVGPHWASYEPRREAPGTARLSTGTLAIADLDDRDRTGIGAHLIFPNTMMASTGEFFATYVAEPVAPDRTVLDLRVRAEPGADGVVLAEAVRSFVAEDIEACERIQVAVRSSAFGVVALARDHEAPIVALHDELRRLLDLTR